METTFNYIPKEKRVGEEELMATIKRDITKRHFGEWKATVCPEGVCVFWQHHFHSNIIAECILPRGSDGLYGAKELMTADWEGARVEHNSRLQVDLWMPDDEVPPQIAIANALARLGCCEGPISFLDLQNRR